MGNSSDEQSVRIIQTTDAYLENVSLVWLDAQLDTTHDCIEAKKRLLAIVNTFQTFIDVDKCITLLTTNPLNQQFCVVVSGAFSSQLISSIVHLPQVITIAIYCFRALKYTSEQNQNQDKLLGIFVDLNSILTALGKCITAYLSSLSTVSTLTVSTNGSSLKYLSKENAIFVWFHLLFHAQCRLPHTTEARIAMVDECKRLYSDNEVQLDQINEFAATYTPEQAVRWYTRDSFLYRIVNRALRTQNIDTIFIFYPFIGDLHDQLVSLHREFLELGAPTFLNVYRGQHIHVDELRKITNNIDGLLSMNSFFSTSFDRALSRVLAQQNTGLESILYEITIDTDVPAAPFSNVGEHSYFPGEQEIIFSVDAVFRVQSACQEIDEYGNVWIVKLRLIDERTEQQLTDLLDYFKHDIDERCSLLTLAELLAEIGDYEGSKKFIKRIRTDFSTDDPELLDLFDVDANKIEIAISLLEKKLTTYESTKAPCMPAGDMLKSKTLSNAAITQCDIGNYDQATLLFCHAIGLDKVSPSLDKRRVLSSWINIGSIIYKKGDIMKALEIYQKVLDVFEGVQVPATHPMLADIHDRIGISNERLGNVREAISHYDKSHAIRLVSLPAGHSSLARSHSNLGRMHRANSNYSVANHHFQSALAIDERPESRTDPIDLFNTLTGLANISRRQGKSNESLQYLERATSLVISDNHPDMAQIHQLMGTLQCDLGNFDKAHAAFQQAIVISRKSNNDLELAEILVDFGRVQCRMDKIEQALDSFRRAYIIREKFLPESEPTVAEVHYEIGSTYFKTNRPRKALCHFSRCLELEEKSLPENHVDLAQSNNSIAAVLHSMGLYDEALVFAEKALQIVLLTLDVADPLVILYQTNLTSLKEILSHRHH
ncbi:unnamed protein product [Rotaria magnacalcarata]